MLKLTHFFSTYLFIGVSRLQIHVFLFFLYKTGSYDINARNKTLGRSVISLVKIIFLDIVIIPPYNISKSRFKTL